MNVIRQLLVILLLYIIICYLPSCSRSDITFAEYVKSLDSIPLPYGHTNTGPILPELSKHADTIGFKKYKKCDCYHPIGTLFKDNLYLVILNISSNRPYKAPLFISYDKIGNKIDSLDLYEDAYDDINSAIIPYLKIYRNNRIVLIDTLKHWDLDKPFHMKPNSLVTTIDSTVYNFSKNGKFIKEKPKKL